MLKNKFKAGILIATLGIPALVFLFLKFFGTNEFDVPYFFPELDEQGEVIVSKGDTVFHQIPDFKLINQDSLEISRDTSKLSVINLFFTRCGTICPPTNTNILRVLENLNGFNGLKVYSISVDPRYDTPTVLKSYISSRKLANANWQMLSGDKAYIYDYAIKGLKISAADASAYDPKITDIDETFIHSDKLLLIDKRGFCRGIYTGTNKFEIDKLIVEAKVLLKQK